MLNNIISLESEIVSHFEQYKTGFHQYRFFFRKLNCRLDYDVEYRGL